MSYLDYLPNDVLNIIYGKVVADTTNDIEAQLVALEKSIEVITQQVKYTPEMLQVLTFEAPVTVIAPLVVDNFPTHPIYDKFLHINPLINLRRRINAKRVRVRVWNHWEIHLHTPETGLMGYRPNHLTVDISEETHGTAPVTNFTVLDEMMRYALHHPIGLHNPVWNYNWVESITVSNDEDDSDGEIDSDSDGEVIRGQDRVRLERNNRDYTYDGVVDVYIQLRTGADYGMHQFGRTHEYSEITEFAQEE
jgi:hypothetical protein